MVVKRHENKKSAALQLVILLFVFLLPLVSNAADAGGKSSLQTIDFQLRWKHQFQFAGYYAAIEKGFYRQEGLEVRLHEGAPDRTPVQEVLAGRAQYAEANSELLYERLKGKPLVALAAIFQHSPSVLLARADADIYSPQDLIGKKVMLMNGQVDADFHAMLLNEGIRPETIKIIPSSFDINDLATGKVAAFNSYLTNEPFFLKQKGIDFVVINPKKYGIDYYSDILFTSEQELKKNPERVKAFRRATLRGWQYAMEHPDEIIELLISRYNVKKTREHLQFEAETMRTLILPDLIDLGHMNPGRWQHMADTFVKVGMIGKDYKLDGFIYDPETSGELLKLRKSLISVTAAGAALLLVVLGLFAVQRRLRQENEQRRQAEEALRESREQLRLQFENMPVGCIVWGLDCVVRSWNPAAERIFGFTAEEAVGRNANQLIVPQETQVDLKTVWNNVLEGDSAVCGINQNIAKDGHLITCEWINTPFRDDGNNISGVISMVQDITARLEHEKEVLKIEKLESVGVLAGGIAHDFNNILTGILGNITFAQMFVDSSHKACKPLAEAEKAALRAGELAQQLLSFAKGGEPLKKTVSIQKLVGEALSLMLRGSSVKAAVEMPDSLHAIEADEGQISQVFNNIIINAVHAMPDGGTLNVTAGNEILSGANPFFLPAGWYVRIVFADNGCGIAENDLKRIFDPYFSTKTTGSGLGLASAHSIIKRHGGNISADSKPGRGATFTIHLPSLGDVCAAPETGAAVQNTGNHAGGSILVMDDEEMIRDLVAEMLKYLGYQVTTCINGEEAIAYYTAAHASGASFAAVIMDLTIPGGMGGKEAARQILELNPEARLIVSSGYSSDPIMSDYSRYGFSGAVAKPYNVAELGLALEALITHQG